MANARPVITLLTDFGRSDLYVGVMKGVIAGICPEANVIDITHEVAPQDVAAGAFLLEHAFSFFPRGTVHLAVVDPGVGTARRPIAVRAGGHLFVGPDNGLLGRAALRAGAARAHLLADTRYFRPTLSNTFHGRDIFAPVAAHLANGVRIDALGPALLDIVSLAPARPRREKGKVLGEVVFVDRFGNLVTNLAPEDLRGRRPARIAVGRVVLGDVRTSYQDVDPGAALAIIGSFGLLEIAVRDGSAARVLGIGKGAPVIVRFGGPGAAK